MHILFKNFFNLSEGSPFPNDLDSGFCYVDGFGYLKRKTAIDSFIVRKCENPLIIKLHNEALTSYQQFVQLFNNYFADHYTHHKNFKPLRMKVDRISEEIEFKFINKNNVFVVYTTYLEFNGKSGEKESVSITYQIPMNSSSPSECRVIFDLVKVPCGYNYFSEAALDNKYEGKYYSDNLLATAYISTQFEKQIAEQFESIDHFNENFDDNIKILTMLVF